MSFRVRIEYTHGYNGLTADIGTKETLDEAMIAADEWDKSQAKFETYIGDITRAFVSDESGENEWIRLYEGEICQVKKDGKYKTDE